MPQTGKKNRKIGRNAKFCQAYRLSHRREHNKIKRLRHHLERFPNDAIAQEAVERCKSLIRG